MDPRINELQKYQARSKIIIYVMLFFLIVSAFAIIQLAERVNEISYEYGANYNYQEPLMSPAPTSLPVTVSPTEATASPSGFQYRPVEKVTPGLRY